MKLIDHIEENYAGNVSAFALRIGEAPQTVHRWCKGVAIPRPETMALIALATDGQVMPNDFYADWIAKARAALLGSTSPGALLAGMNQRAS